MGFTSQRSLVKSGQCEIAAQTTRESLNKHLLTGSDLTNGVVGVLCCFRKNPLAFMCDLEAMTGVIGIPSDSSGGQIGTYMQRQ